MNHTDIDEFVFAVGQIQATRNLVWQAEQNFNKIDKEALFNKYLGRKMEVSFRGIGGTPYTCTGIVEFAGFDEFGLKSVEWSVEPTFAQGGPKAVIDYEDIYDIKVL